MDNLSSHKRFSTLRFLPLRGPDFIPIEMACSNRKPLLRKVADRTSDGLSKAIGRFPDDFGSREYANFFAAAGYDAD